MFENFDIVVCEVFKEAERQRNQLRHEYVGTEHLLLAILKKDTDLIKKIQKFNLTYDNFLEEVKNTLPPTKKKTKDNIYTPLLKRVIARAQNTNEKVSQRNLFFHLLDEGEGVAIRLLMSMNVDVDALYNFLKGQNDSTSNLQLFKIGKVLNEYISIEDKVVGRDKEIDILIETLLRKKKNNPLLIGDAGVGKSAIVEELARRIVNNNVPDKLLNTKIVMLEMGSLVSGTRYRGEFEERLTTIINEIINNPNIILFIDEIHSMVNAGAAEGAISASDILKPYLARGDIKCIGATTKMEYEKFIQVDKALSRRFEPIIINEPNEEETFNILKSIKGEYTNFHKINIDDETLQVLVHLAGTYFPNRRNPDKSLELLDSVMSYVKLRAGSNLIKNKELELKKININKIKEIEKGNYKEALKNNMLENKLKKEISNLKNTNKLWISKEDIIDVLEYKNNIIISDKKINIITKNMQNNYDKKIINQITKMLHNKYRASTLLLNGEYGNFINDLSSALNYEIIKLIDESSIDKMFNKIKYYPSSIIVVSDDKNFTINNLIKKITKDNIVEYKDEYISFNNSIIILLGKSNNVGFNNSAGISNIPIDEIISFQNCINA
ncbi:MAG: ATP-dependent Clp protease ATP-binding subunit [Firmicutes bacterium]|nr:ATP-dependent Clp protease ATP-binding subunit [Bacillota bacterium]